jgi:TetR/AcrR family transcriptional regulator
MPRIDPPQRLATDLRQASLIEAALQLAALKSPADITTGDLAKAVGISQGAVFRHFPSKEAVWLAVIVWTEERLLGQLRAAVHAHAALPSTFNPLAALQAVFVAHVEFVMTHPGVPRVVFLELQRAQETPLKVAVRGLMQQYRVLVMDLLQNAQGKGLLRSDVDLPCAAVLFLGSVQGLVMQALMSGQLQSIAAQAPGVFTLYFYGIANKEAP